MLFRESSESAADEVGVRQGAQVGNWCVVAAGGKDVGGHRSGEGILCGLSPQFYTVSPSQHSSKCPHLLFLQNLP